MSTPLVKRAYNLGLKAVPNFMDALTEEAIAYYEQHLDELPTAIRRGFTIPGQEVASVAIAPSSQTLHKASETDLDYWLDKTQEFTKKHLGVEINLRQSFDIPVELPWKSVIPVFDPGNLDNRGMVNKAIKGLGFQVYEENNVMKYSGSEAVKQPTLHFIENSIRPNADTMGKSPDDLRQTGKLYLRLRGYGLAFATYNFAKGEYLDPQTWTWFPEDSLSDCGVACGGWDPVGRKVRFLWGYSVRRNSDMGARLAMPVSLKT